jgi:hypothetical protein
MVHRIAEQDGMPKGLKITNCTGQVLYDSTWIAGEDYDEDEFEKMKIIIPPVTKTKTKTKTVTTAMMMMICMTKWIQMQSQP